MSEAYYKTMLPYAKQVEQATGLPSSLIVSWWSWETNFGTNRGAKELNNHGGIKYIDGRSPYQSYKSGMYAGYGSIDLFVKDYIRILNIKGHGYPEVLDHQGETWEKITRDMNISAYAEADYNIPEIIKRAKAAMKITGETIAAPSLPSTENLSSQELKTYAGIGLALFAAVALANKK
jgi:uncharacterized FlgJ-related protein